MADLKITTIAKMAIVDQLDIPKAEQTRLYIEGYASVNRDAMGNKNVDRDNEVYDIPSLDIENFRKNGPILFNHNWSSIIGRVTEIEKTFQGLYIKAEIHKVPGFEDVFYGVQNGLIKAFSISAIPKNFEYLENEDALELRDAELIEISVLSVPSNAQSLFDVVNAKSLRFSAKEVAKQNDMTLCELKGICGITPKEKGIEMKNKEVTEPTEAPEIKVEPKEEPKVEPKEEPKVEVKEDPIKADDIAAAVVIAQEKAEDLRKEREEQAKKELEAQEKAEADAKVARVTDAIAYINETTENFINTNVDDLDPDTIEDLYEVLSSNVEKIESKISEVITEQLKTA